MNDRERRNVKSAVILYREFNNLEQELYMFLDIDIRNTPASEMQTIGQHCKEIHSNYKSISQQLIDHKIKSGCTHEANDLRSKRIDMRKEVELFINVLNSNRDDGMSEITFNANSTLSGDEFNVNNSFRTSSPVNPDNTQDNGNTGLESLGKELDRIKFLVDAKLNGNVDSKSSRKSEFTPYKGEGSGLDYNSANKIRHRNTNPFITIDELPETYYNLDRNQNYGGIPPPTQFQDKPQNFPSHPLMSDGCQASNRTDDARYFDPPPLYADPRRNTTVGRAPLYSSANGPPPLSNTPADTNQLAFGFNVLSQHMALNQLYQKTCEPFDGNPEKYMVWVHSMQRKFELANLDPIEKLTILHENASGKPKKILSSYLYNGSNNPQYALEMAWQALYEKFGSGTRISSSVDEKLKGFGNIKSAHDTDKLGELLNLCHVILVNLPKCRELGAYNLPQGITLLWEKLPIELQNSWRTYSANFKRQSGNVPPTLSEFIKFLESKQFEYSDPAYSRVNKFTPSSKPAARTVLVSQTETTNAAATPQEKPKENDYSCPFHPKAVHKLADCKAFAKKPYDEKRSFIIENKLCFSCLGEHLKRNCPGAVTCGICNANHATAVHPVPRESPKGNNSNSAETPATQKTDSNATGSHSSLCTEICEGREVKSCSKVLLVDIVFPSGSSKSLQCYAILDEQSSGTFVESSVLDYFGIQTAEMEYKIRTLTGLETMSAQGDVKGFKVKGVQEKNWIDLPDVIVNDFIPNCKEEIATPEVVSKHSHISYLKDKFLPINKEAKVLVLIGRNCGPAMKTYCKGHKAPYAHHTALGWALVGETCLKSSDSNCNTVMKIQLDRNTMEHYEACPTFSAKNPNASLDVNPFLELPDDEMPGASKEDQVFNLKITKGLHINDEGNITMPLPFRDTAIKLPDNKIPVRCRTVNTLNRLKTDPTKLELAVQAMQANLDARHVELIPPKECNDAEGKRWYIPVHPVNEPHKNKVRLTFDSAASYKGTSLNQQLLQGPDVNTQLFTVLMRFRFGQIAFAADVEAMFHAFHLEESDKDYVRFFWWMDNNPQNQIVEYRATRHIFGNTCSPSIANIGLRYAVVNSPESTERARNFVFKHFYVDDGCASVNCEEEAIRILKDTRASLGSYNIHLHKIISNSAKVLEAFPPSELNKSVRNKEFDKSNNQKVLGVEWEVDSDSLVVRTNVPSRPYTPRGCLSVNNSPYDPFGLAAPILLNGRILQRLMLSPSTEDGDKLDWDDPLPDYLRPKWDEWIRSLCDHDGKLKIQRAFRPPEFGDVAHESIHVFSDASLEGTGFVMYLRSVNTQGDVQVSFLLGSSRIAPRKTVSVPRLELCAALEASLSASKVIEDLEFPKQSVVFYTDSQVVLGYLTNTTKRFRRYVTSRVDNILKMFGADVWKYISTHENPADLASRCQTFESLLTSCWLRGPAFLYEEPLRMSPDAPNIVELPEVVEDTIVMKTTPQNPNIFSELMSRVSDYKKLITSVRYVLSFIRKVSEKVMIRKGKTSSRQSDDTSELASLILIRAAQGDCFPTLVNQQSTPKNLESLSPFIDQEGIARVGGRLKRSLYSDQIKQPILLPQNHPLTTSVISYFHRKTVHQGRVVTSAAIREGGFYIHKGSGVVKKYIGKCVTCRRLRAQCSSQLMADLPPDRLDESPPFTYCGIDVFGPFKVSEGKVTRNNTGLKKVWALVFVCLVTKAIHIEPLPMMDTNSFKLALRRFFNLRGVCKKLRSDRGTNFVGARNEDGYEWNFSAIKDEAERHGCCWEMNPPHSSHFGGIWERAIRSIRKILDSSLLLLGQRPPSRDEIHTFFTEACSIVNNTPLYESTQDPNDEMPLSPAHLLTLKGTPNPAPLETFSDQDILAYGRRRWRRVQRISDYFWQRWRTEYLQRLQHRQKWTKNQPNISKGDIVIMKVNGCRRNNWPMAKVHEVRISADGLVRSVTLQLANEKNGNPRFLDRPISKIVPILKVNEA